MSSMPASEPQNLLQAQRKLLLEHLLAYQAREERTVTSKEYAIHLGIHETTFNLLFNKKRPISKKMCAHLAQVTGDPRFYSLRGMPYSDPNYEYVSNEWATITPEQQQAISEQLREYKIENEKNRQVDEHEARESSPTKP